MYMYSVIVFICTFSIVMSVLNIDKSIKKALGNSRSLTNSKWCNGLFVKNDFDGDRVSNKKDCQPFNVMRQDKIKSTYGVYYKGIPIGYGKKVRMTKTSTTTIQDVKDAFKKHPELVKQSKGVGLIRIESYKSPKRFLDKKHISRAQLNLDYDKKGKLITMITIQANPHKTDIKYYGKKRADELHKKKTAQELAHEIQHYQQVKRGDVKRGELYSQKQEQEALQKMKKYRLPSKEYKLKK